MADLRTLQEKAKAKWEDLEKAPRILVGDADCGRAMGSQRVLTAFRKEIEQRHLSATVMPVGCLGLCSSEVLVRVIKPGKPPIVYGSVTPTRVPAVIEDSLISDRPRDMALGSWGDSNGWGLPNLLEDPGLRLQTRIATQDCGSIDPWDIDHYIANGGYTGLSRALGMTSAQVLEEVKNSGLRGRGGAAFPVGRKWEFLATAPGPIKYVACNAEEGDPGAYNDRRLMESNPHLVLEGVTICGYATGAVKGFIHVRTESALSVARLRRALEQMYADNLLGKNILGSNFSYDIEIKETGEAYECGEETALMESVEGKRGFPRARPPFPAQVGIFGKPTNVNNVKSYAFVPIIMARGAQWYASYGTEKSKGTILLCLSGNIARPGLTEVPMGITLRQAIEQVGGGVPNGKAIKAMQLGGPLGGFLPPSSLDLALDFDSLAGTGAMLGSGGIVVLDQDVCVVQFTRLLTAFNQKESCGKCIPCRVGTRRVLEIYDAIVHGRGRPEHLDRILELAQTLTSGSLCGLGQLSGTPLRASLRYFKEEYEAHVKDKRCPTGQCAMGTG